MTTWTPSHAANTMPCATVVDNANSATNSTVEVRLVGVGARNRKARIEDQMRGENITWCITFASLAFCLWRAFSG